MGRGGGVVAGGSGVVGVDRLTILPTVPGGGRVSPGDCPKWKLQDSHQSTVYSCSLGVSERMSQGSLA